MSNCSPFLVHLAEALAAEGRCALLFNFSYSEARRKLHCSSRAASLLRSRIVARTGDATTVTAIDCRPAPGSMARGVPPWGHVEPVVVAQDGDTEEALPLLERSATLLEPVVAADPADLSARSRVAENCIGLGYAHMALGSRSTLTADVRQMHWREAKAQFEAGAAFWVELRDRGVTVGDEAAKPDLIAREIAKCDAALASGPQAVNTRKP